MTRDKLIEHRAKLQAMRKSLVDAQSGKLTPMMATATAVVAAEAIAEVVMGMIDDAITFQELLEQQSRNMLVSAKAPARCDRVVEVRDPDSESRRVEQCALPDGHAGECMPDFLPRMTLAESNGKA